jgi:hypothetical protein
VGETLGFQRAAVERNSLTADYSAERLFAAVIARVKNKWFTHGEAPFHVIGAKRKGRMNRPLGSEIKAEADFRE